MKVNIKSRVPLAVHNILRKIPGYPKIRYTGDYSSWSAALEEASGGYTAAEIFCRVKHSASRVKKGEAVFERDAVCFYQEEYRWPVLSCLLFIAAQRNGILNVIDFGGSLGSFYFQHKRFIQQLIAHRWFVVEQSHYVDYAKSSVQNGHLYFHTTIQECLSQTNIHVVLFSSVLQYLEYPYEILQEISNSKIQYILIDRTPFISQLVDKLKIQHVPKSIYKASYPLWFLSLDRFKRKMDKFGYLLETEFTGNDQFVGAICKGFLFKRASS